MRVLLFSDVTLFTYNVSTILSPIVASWADVLRRSSSFRHHSSLTWGRNDDERLLSGWKATSTTGRPHCARRLSLQNKFVGSTLNSKSPLLVQSLKILRFIPTSVALAGLVILR